MASLMCIQCQQIALLCVWGVRVALIRLIQLAKLEKITIELQNRDLLWPVSLPH